MIKYDPSRGTLAQRLPVHQRLICQMASNAMTNKEILKCFLEDTEGRLNPNEMSLTIYFVKDSLKYAYRALGIRHRIQLLGYFIPESYDKSSFKPSDFERAILDCIGNAQTDAEIAKELNVTISTIHTAVIGLRIDSGIATRFRLAVWWIMRNQTG